MTDPLLTADDVAVICKVSRSLALAWFRSGALGHYRMGVHDHIDGPCGFRNGDHILRASDDVPAAALRSLAAELREAR